MRVCVCIYICSDSILSLRYAQTDGCTKRWMPDSAGKRDNEQLRSGNRQWEIRESKKAT